MLVQQMQMLQRRPFRYAESTSSSPLLAFMNFSGNVQCLFSRVHVEAGGTSARAARGMEPEMPHQGPFRLTPPCERENGTTVIKFFARVTLETRCYVFKCHFTTW